MSRWRPSKFRKLSALGFLVLAFSCDGELSNRFDPLTFECGQIPDAGGLSFFKVDGWPFESAIQQTDVFVIDGEGRF